MTKQEAKKAYVETVLSTTGGKGVVVCPVFINEGTDKVPNWQPTDTAVIESTNPEWCAINVMSITTSYNEQGFENLQVMSALIRRKIAGAEEKYVPGAVLNGKIATMETLTPTDETDSTRDIKYAGELLREAGIPCMVNDQPIYQRRYYTEQLDKQDVTLAHTNADQIQQVRLAAKAAASKPAAGIRQAAGKVAGKRP